MPKPYLEPEPEFFDRASVPKEIADLLDEWPEIDASTARLVRAAVSSRSPRQMRRVWDSWPRGRNWRRRCGRAGADVLLADQCMTPSAPAPNPDPPRQ